MLNRLYIINSSTIKSLCNLLENTNSKWIKEIYILNINSLKKTQITQTGKKETLKPQWCNKLLIKKEILKYFPKMKLVIEGIAILLFKWIIKLFFFYSLFLFSPNLLYLIYI